MPYEQEFHVIVHPSLLNNEFPEANVRAQQAWRSWGWTGEASSQKVSTLLVFHGWDSLADTSYLNDLPSGVRIRIGGQVTDVCVRMHVEHIADHPRVKEFAIVFDRQALVGSEEGADNLVLYLREQGISASIQG